MARKQAKNDSIVKTCYLKRVPSFGPAVSDCSAGFGIVMHQTERNEAGEADVAFDSGKDFRELTDIKLAANEAVVAHGGETRVAGEELFKVA